MLNIKKSEIENHIKNISKEDIFKFAEKYNIYLSKQELDWTYSFIKNNYNKFIDNPKSLNLNNYKSNFSEINFNKLTNLYNKYSNYLNIIKITD